MIYKKLLQLCTLCLAFSIGMQANEKEIKKVEASLGEATVFFQGAELTHKATTSVNKGVNEISITNLSPNIDVNSLKIKTTKGVVVTSSEYSLDFVNKKAVNVKEKVIKDSIELYKKKIIDYDILIKTNNDLLELLKANKNIGGSETGLKVSELMSMVDYYSSKSNEINKALSSLNEKKRIGSEMLSRLQQQLQQESIKNVKSMGVLKLNLTSPLAISSEFTITYFTKNSGWVPYYDINVPGPGEPIQIASKAKVRQTTGLDWNKVKLTLSTATPSNNKAAPLFSAWFLDFRNYALASGKAMREMSTRRLAQNSYSYDMAPQALMDKKSEVMDEDEDYMDEESANVQPLYLINGEYATADEVSNLSPDMIESTQVLKDKTQTGIYGSRASNGVILIITKGMDDFVTRDEGELNSLYNIDLPYTIEGNGKYQNIDLQTQKVDVEFKHYAVPKLDTEVFILAEISDWQKLGLLSGKANVTYDGTYVGETNIDASSVAKKLTLTLGTDKRVVVKREKLQDFSSRKFLGKDVKQEFTYKLTVKNNQNKPIKMTLKDQYPLTNQKDINVELDTKATSEPTFENKEAGVLSWEFELGAGQNKEFRLVYSVKYPKDKPINL